MQQYDLQKFTEDLANSSDDLIGAYVSLCELARQLVGHKLFTLMVVERDSGEAARIYSSMPEAYPVSGKKLIEASSWTEQVIDRHETFVANDIEGIAEVFGDFELIASLGCESVINIPVVVAGIAVGTINCLAEAGHYTPDRVHASQALKLPGAVCFLAFLSNTSVPDLRDR